MISKLFLFSKKLAIEKCKLYFCSKINTWTVGKLTLTLTYVPRPNKGVIATKKLVFARFGY